MSSNNFEIINMLNEHKSSFNRAEVYAKLTKQPIPTHTVNWSQILVSLVTGIEGLDKRKGPDLSDGSDVKGASIWGAIDTPRFNGVVPAGRVLSDYEKTQELYKNIYFVLWDYKYNKHSEKTERCRIWCVSPSKDILFKEIAIKWYSQVNSGEIKSTNFQLHPPRNIDNNIFKNNCGTLNYPLMMEAIFDKKINSYKIIEIDLEIPIKGRCSKVEI